MRYRRVQPLTITGVCTCRLTLRRMRPSTRGLAAGRHCQRCLVGTGTSLQRRSSTRAHRGCWSSGGSHWRFARAACTSPGPRPLVQTCPAARASKAVRGLVALGAAAAQAKRSTPTGTHLRAVESSAGGARSLGRGNGPGPTEVSRGAGPTTGGVHHATRDPEPTRWAGRRHARSAVPGARVKTDTR
jgi:hypothetical protein